MANRNQVLGLLAGVVLWPAVATAMLVPTPVSELVMQSELILRGKVIDLQSAAKADQSAIYTDVTLHVSDVVLSRLPGQVQQEITFHVAGGEIAGEEMRTSIDPVFEEGDEGVFLLQSNGPDGPLSLVGQSQGFFLIEGGMVSVEGARRSVEAFVSEIRGY